MYYVLNYNQDEHGSVYGRGYYSSKPENLPEWQIECTQDQHDNHQNYRVVKGEIAHKEDSELLSAQKLAKINELKAAASVALTSGFTSSALGSVHTYGSTSVDQTNLHSAVVAAIGAPEGWTTLESCKAENADWAYVAHTGAQLQQVASDWNTYFNSVRSKLNSYIVAINAADATSASIAAITW